VPLHQLCLCRLIVIDDLHLFFSVAGASSLQPRVLVSPAVFVKAYTSIASLARDLGQLQRVLNDKPYQPTLRAFTPGQRLDILKHPVFKDQGMFPVDPQFLDVSDACHSAMTQLIYSHRCSSVLDDMDKGNKDSKQAKGRLEEMSKNSVLPPALSSFIPKSIKDHRSVTTLIKPPGRLSLQPIRNEVHAIDPNIEYLVAFEVYQNIVSFY
jgi:hypothetical protein